MVTPENVFLDYACSAGCNSADQTITVVSQGQVHIDNLHEFPVPIVCYHMLNRLFQVDTIDIHRARDFSLKPGADGVVEVSLVDVSGGTEERRKSSV